MIQIKVRDDFSRSRVKIPKRSYPGDAGWDLFLAEGGIIWPFCCRDLRTGWDVKIPDDCWGAIKARSSTLYRRRLMVLEGVIDQGYVGPLSVVVFNPTPWPRRVHKEERLAQLIVMPLAFSQDSDGTQYRQDTVKILARDEYLPRGSRGPRGFGSTGYGERNNNG